MGCKYRVMDKCKAKGKEGSFCFGKDGCSEFEDEAAFKESEKCRCMYCGTELDWVRSNNPYDDGLHDIPDKYGDTPSVCCSQCNAITSINRNFKRLIDDPEKFALWIFMMKDTIAGLEQDKDKVIAHYRNAKMRPMGAKK